MADARDVSSLPLARSVVELLLKGGFRFVSDLQSIQPLELAQEVGIAPDVALSVIQCAESSMLNPVAAEKLQFSAKDLLAKSDMSRPIISFCKAMDVMLGGGIQIGQITEFCGVPGVGKTQLGIQLAINVQIPELFNGIGGEAIYLDTEGSFMVERVAEMAKEVSHHLGKIAKSTTAKIQQNNPNSDSAHILTHLSAAENMTMERFLEGIHVFRAHDQSETIATIKHLSSYLKAKTKIKLIVIDSIAFHFRQDLDDTVTRSRVLSSIAQSLNQIAYEHNIAIVLINHVTTRFDSTFNNNNRDMNKMEINRLVPALGEQWSHCITNRVMLAWDAGFQRQAVLTKSPTMPSTSAYYCVCQRGIRDIPVEVQQEIFERKRKFGSVDGSQQQS